MEHSYAFESMPRSFGNYYVPATAIGDSTTPATTGSTSSSVPVGAEIVAVGLNAGAGYLVGKMLGYPIAGAVASGTLGIIGMLAVAIYAVHHGGGK
jgi:hypothetical protein